MLDFIMMLFRVLASRRPAVPHKFLGGVYCDRMVGELRAMMDGRLLYLFGIQARRYGRWDCSLTLVHIQHE